nr:MAG TPA: hypothetical protein [Caudoviricetes sp.]
MLSQLGTQSFRLPCLLHRNSKPRYLPRNLASTGLCCKTWVFLFVSFCFHKRTDYILILFKTIPQTLSIYTYVLYSLRPFIWLILSYDSYICQHKVNCFR